VNQVAGVWHGKGKALVALGREEEVLAAYEQAIQLYPDNAYLWQYKGGAAP
jgi:tetratricopeptide (TPR) repeat protein